MSLFLGHFFILYVSVLIANNLNTLFIISLKIESNLLIKNKV